MKQFLITDEQELDQLKEEIISGVLVGLRSFLLPLKAQPPISEWVDDKEAKQILGYRSKTKMQNMRDTKAIVFSKFGRKIKYLRQSLIDYIEGNKIS
jgi:hypothetical protein